MENFKQLLIIAAAIAYPLSIFIDCSIYNLRFLLIGKQGVKYWLSMLTIYQYIARFFMLIFVPTTAYLTESFQSLETTSTVLVTAHFGVIIILTLSIRFFKSTSMLSLFIVQKLSINSSKDNVNEAFLSPINIVDPINFKEKKAINLFVSSLTSQFLVSISMTLIFILNFLHRDSILFYNSLMQALNMCASIILFIYIDPIVMSSFDKEYKGQNNIKIIYYSRILAHSISFLFFSFVYYLLN